MRTIQPATAANDAAFEEMIAHVIRTRDRSGELVEWSRWLGRVSRRLCRPGVRGASDLEAHGARTERTIEKARRGALPAPFGGSKSSVGPGSAKNCNGCSERIAAHEREVVMIFSATITVRFHAECYRAWLTFNLKADGVADNQTPA